MPHLRRQGRSSQLSDVGAVDRTMSPPPSPPTSLRLDTTDVPPSLDSSQPQPSLPDRLYMPTFMSFTGAGGAGGGGPAGAVKGAERWNSLMAKLDLAGLSRSAPAPSWPSSSTSPPSLSPSILVLSLVALYFAVSFLPRLIRHVSNLRKAYKDLFWMQRDPDAFFADARRNNRTTLHVPPLWPPSSPPSSTGDPTIDGAGNGSGGMTFLLSYPHIRRLYSSPPPGLSYSSFKADIHLSVFGFSPSAAYDVSSMDELERFLHRELARDSLDGVTERYFAELEKSLERLEVKVTEQEALGAGRGLEVQLCATIYSTVYTASALAFFGPDFPAEKALGPLKAFDTHLGSLFTAASLPLLPTSVWTRLLANKCLKARDEMRALFVEWMSERVTLENGEEVEAWTRAGGMVRGLKGMMESAGWDSADVATAMMVVFFVLQANAADGAAWVLLHLLQSPHALHTALIETSTLPPSASAFTPALLSDQNLPLITSAIQETLRVCTSVFSVRSVEQDVLLSAPTLEGKAKEGETTPTTVRSVALGKGARVLTANRATCLDGRLWGPDVDVWRADRFLSPSTGRLDPTLTRQLLHFGGGPTRCAGRHFAILELTSLVAVWLRRFTVVPSDMAVVDDAGRVKRSAEVVQARIVEAGQERKGTSPGFRKANIGLGVVLQPDGDLQVTLRRRRL